MEDEEDVIIFADKDKSEERSVTFQDSKTDKYKLSQVHRFIHWFT